ncbi:MAG TPA: hypothetical protein VN893_24580 [Bryobacteraceae bacterium]|nr:hypothetical protein [Bryobacteraceae bacterium]
MPTADAILAYVAWATLASFFVLYLRLRQQGLQHVYRFFAAFVLFRAVRDLALVALPALWYGLHHRPYVRLGNNVYAWVWVLLEPPMWILHILVVLELYSLVLQNYKGIASMGRWAVFAGLTVAVVLSCATLPAEMSHSAEHYTLLRWAFVASRGVHASLVIFLLFITAFLAWFPVPLNRNVVLYSMVYALYFITDTLAQMAYNLLGLAGRNAVNFANDGMELLCLWVWIVFLNRAGEAKPVIIGHAWTAQHEDELMGQLAAINTSLTRSARR